MTFRKWIDLPSKRGCDLCDVIISKLEGAWVSDGDGFSEAFCDDYYFVCPDCYYEYSEQDLKTELKHEEKVYLDRFLDNCPAYRSSR